MKYIKKFNEELKSSTLLAHLNNLVIWVISLVLIEPKN
jgi:hypothetical protein